MCSNINNRPVQEVVGALHSGGELPLEFVDDPIERPTGIEGENTHLLRKRIRELEETVFRRNVELRDRDSLQMTKDGLLDKLAKAEVENNLLLEQRDQFSKNFLFSEAQLKMKVKECDDLKESFRIQQTYLLQEQKRAKNLEKKVVVLEQEVLLWQAKSEKSEKEGENYERTKKFLPPLDPVPTYLTGSGNENQPPTIFKRRKIVRTPTASAFCASCDAIFSKSMRPDEVKCLIHRCPPQPLAAWKEKISGLDERVNPSDLGAYKFWPCCEKYGIKKQPGCLKLKSHDIVVPEDI